MNPLVVLQWAAPVAFAALGEAVNQRGGLLNIGLEGMVLTGAFFGTLACLGTGNPWLGTLAAVGSGLLMAAVTAWFMVLLGTDQVVAGTATNLLAIGVTGSLFRARFGESGQLLSVAKLPNIGGIDPLLVLLALLVPALTWLVYRSAFGLALRAAGEYPKAAEAAGFSVHRLRTLGLLTGGAMAGLAGAYLSLVIAGSFTENMVEGRGFVALALVTFGRWRPIWVVGAALLVGAADSLQYWLQGAGVGVPHQLLVGLPYALALLVLVVAGKGTRAPAALAQPYRRER